MKDITSQKENAVEIDQSKAPDADQFRVGDVWETPNGFLHLVISVNRASVSNASCMFATLRAGSDGAGRKSLRRWDDTGWGCGRPWTRVSWGGN